MSHDEIRAIVREEFARMFSMMLQPSDPKADQWVGLKDAWKPLGYPSHTAIYKDLQAGVLRVGKEVRDRRKPGAKIARYQVNITAANKRLSEDPAKRRSV